jgi:hypothetical protein
MQFRTSLLLSLRVALTDKIKIVGITSTGLFPYTTAEHMMKYLDFYPRTHTDHSQTGHLYLQKM